MLSCGVAVYVVIAGIIVIVIIVLLLLLFLQPVLRSGAHLRQQRGPRHPPDVADRHPATHQLVSGVGGAGEKLVIWWWGMDLGAVVSNDGGAGDGSGDE